MGYTLILKKYFAPISSIFTRLYRFSIITDYYRRRDFTYVYLSNAGRHMDNAYFLQLGDELLQDLAALLVKITKLDTIKAMYLYVANLQYDNSSAVRGLPWEDRRAPDTIRRGSGNCVDKAILLAALLRAVNIPARVSAGTIYDNGRPYGHVWINVFYWNAWRPLDPTESETYRRYVDGEYKGKSLRRSFWNILFDADGFYENRVEDEWAEDLNTTDPFQVGDGSPVNN